MKRFLEVMVLFLIGGLLNAADPVYVQKMVNEPALTKNTSYYIDLNAANVDYFSAQAVYSNNTSFTQTQGGDGYYSTGTLILACKFSSVTYASEQLNIGGYIFTAGKDFKITSTSSTAMALAYAIGQRAGLGLTSTCTLVSNTYTYVESYSKYCGKKYNYTVTASTIGISNMVGGRDGTIDYNSNVIISTNDNGSYPRGLAVFYDNRGGTDPTGLTDGATYYVLPVSSSSFKLMLSSDVVSGKPIAFYNQISLGGGQFTLNPISTSGSATLTWQGSNDNTNYATLNVPTLTVSTPYTSSNYLWDFGFLGFRYIRASITAPTFGSLNFTVIGNGKRQANP